MIPMAVLRCKNGGVVFCSLPTTVLDFLFEKGLSAEMRASIIKLVTFGMKYLTISMLDNAVTKKAKSVIACAANVEDIL